MLRKGRPVGSVAAAGKSQVCHDRISNNDGKPTFSPTIAESRTSQDAQKRQRARSFGLIAFRTPRLPRFTFCATAEIET